LQKGELDTRLLLAIGACVVAVAALGLSMCGSSADTSSPTASVESYFGAIADGDAEDACSVGTEAFQQEAIASVIGTPAEGETCEQAVENVPDDARELIEDVTVETLTSDDGRAVVEVTIEAEDFPTQPVRYDVVREGDEWLVAGLGA
jgi:Domain of unknown function (DUF4878)